MADRTPPSPMSVALEGNPPVRVIDYRFTPPPVVHVREQGAVLPDPDWEFEDAQGHPHRWTRTTRSAIGDPAALPTLVPNHEHVPCDGSCGAASVDDCESEGYDITLWHCATCGDRVAPAYIPDTRARTTGVPIVTGPPTATVVTDEDPGAPLDGPGPYDVVIHGAGGDLTGLGYVSNVATSPDDDGPTRRITIIVNLPDKPADGRRRVL